MCVSNVNSVKDNSLSFFNCKIVIVHLVNAITFTVDREQLFGPFS